MSLPQTKKNAFTLIEIIVVLSITAILIGLSSWGSTLFKRTSELEGAGNEMMANFLTIESAMRSSVPSTKITNVKLLDNRIDALAFYFNNGSYSIQYCIKQTPNFNCSASEYITLKSPTYADVSISMATADAARCRLIIFERKTGQIYSATSLVSTPQKGAVCNLNIKHNITMSDKRIVIDLNNNSYALQ